MIREEPTPFLRIFSEYLPNFLPCSMNRRTALKRFVLTGTAAMLLPGCLSDSKKVSSALNNLKVTVEDEELLGEIADTMIPATDKPGAKQVGAHLFALVMVDDCVEPEAKEKFMKGLRSFNTSVPKGKEFMKASPVERLEGLKAFEKELANADETLVSFYKMARHYIIQGYTTSQYFLTEVKPYNLVPGPIFKGCVPVTNKI
jgi:hypothetical protein